MHNQLRNVPAGFDIVQTVLLVRKLPKRLCDPREELRSSESVVLKGEGKGVERRVAGKAGSRVAAEVDWSPVSFVSGECLVVCRGRLCL